MKLEQLLLSIEALKKLGACNLPATQAFQIAKVLKAVQVELETFGTVQQQLLERYGKADERQARSYHFETEEQRHAYEQEIQALLQTEVTLTFTPLPIAALDGNKFQPADLLALEWLIAPE